MLLHMVQSWVTAKTCEASIRVSRRPSIRVHPRPSESTRFTRRRMTYIRGASSSVASAGMVPTSRPAQARAALARAALARAALARAAQGRAVEF